jgi:hypothetical protein
MSNLPVAETILEQLGGNQFRVMTGATNFVGSATRLTFRLPGGGGFCKSGINYVSITLDPSDTYTMQFYRIRNGNLSRIAEHSDVYFDMLQDLFEKETGVYVTLARRR